MGDGLPEKLYTAWRSSQADPTAHWSWGNVESETRVAWEAVAVVARGQVGARIGDLEAAALAQRNTISELQHARETDGRKIAKIERRARDLESATTRIVEIDQDNCPHNTAIEPDTGECLTCGAFLP